MNTLRNRIAHRLASTALRLASRDYRLMVEGAWKYGLAAAARDSERGRELWDTPAPMDTIDDLPTLRTLPSEPSGKAVAAAHDTYFADSNVAPGWEKTMRDALRAAYKVDSDGSRSVRPEEKE